MVSEQLRLRMLSATRRPTDITWLHSMYSCTSLNVSYLHLNIAFCLFDFRYLLVEKNPSLVKLYKEKMGQYLQRAEYIKKTVLDVPDQPASGGTAQAQKPKAGGTPGGGGEPEEDKEEEKLAGALGSAIVSESPNVSWDESQALRQLKRA